MGRDLDYSPGYFYGNVKTHKPGNPIRPIISQTPTPSYQLAKRLNELIAPFIPKKFSLKSSDEFLDVLKVNGRRGLLASLDAESLFTNVPIDETVEIILRYVYENPTMPALPLVGNYSRRCCTYAQRKRHSDVLRAAYTSRSTESPWARPLASCSPKAT